MPISFSVPQLHRHQKFSFALQAARWTFQRDIHFASSLTRYKRKILAFGALRPFIALASWSCFAWALCGQNASSSRSDNRWNYHMLTDRQGNLVLRFMRLCNLDLGDSVPLGAIEFGEGRGCGSSEVQHDLVRADPMGWIVATDLQIQLTRYEFMVCHPANDNVASAC